METTVCFTPAEILLPHADIPLAQWGCIACDQFTSEMEYWQGAQSLVGDAPSALHLVLPEVYLNGDDVPARVTEIQSNMQQYLAEVLTRTISGFIYLERKIQSGKTRKGLVGKVDLEAYSYQKGALPSIRPSESTVVERIPPRLAVRRGAPLETPHVMMLVDDAAQTVLEPIAAIKETLAPVYEGELMQGGLHLAGWAVTDPAQVAQITAAVAALGSRESFDAKYPAAKGAPTLTMAVGDGNHSLATAKAHWEEIKATLTPAQAETHPARYCLCEICNVHSDAIEIEPIHRVLFGADADGVLLALAAHSDTLGVGLHTGEGSQNFTMITPKQRHALSFQSPTEPLTVGTIDSFIAHYLSVHPEAEVDYVHGEASVQALCEKGGVGFLMPPFAKSDIFKGVVLGGVLPRKTFSMGHAEEKRYYVECRKIATD